MTSIEAARQYPEVVISAGDWLFNLALQPIILSIMIVGSLEA